MSTETNLWVIWKYAVACGDTQLEYDEWLKRNATVMVNTRINKGIREDITDLLLNLRHLCDRKKLNFAELDKMASQHHAAASSEIPNSQF